MKRFIKTLAFCNFMNTLEEKLKLNGFEAVNFCSSFDLVEELEKSTYHIKNNDYLDYVIMPVDLILSEKNLKLYDLSDEKITYYVSYAKLSRAYENDFLNKEIDCINEEGKLESFYLD